MGVEFFADIIAAESGHQQLQHASPSEMRFSGKQEIMLSWIEVEW